MRKTIRLTMIVLTVTFLARAGLDGLFYHPDAKVYRTPAQDGYVFEEVKFASRDKTQLSGWFIPAQGEALGTVIHFHGNAQNMSAHYPFVSWLPASGFNLFVFDYRGYGKSKGKPSRQGVYEDGVAAVEYMKSRPDVDQSRIILFGQSLGGANAIAVVGSNDFGGIAGVATESAFSTYKSVATDHAGLLKPLAPLAIGNKHSPKKVVKEISPIPLLIIHGTHDKVVDYKHAKKLYNAAAEPRTLWTIKGGRHTEALGKYRKEYVPRLHAVFKSWAESASAEEEE